MAVLLSVIIATRNRASSLAQTLEMLAQMTFPRGEWEIIVVDNASSDATRDTVMRAAAHAPVHYAFEQRQGKSFAVNAGIAQARGEFLAFTDDDVIVDRDWGGALVAAMERTGYIGAGGRIVAEWTEHPPRWLTADGPDRLMNVVAFDAGSARELMAAPFGPNMGFRRSAFERYGLFRTDIGPGAGRYLPGQDTEFGRRLLAAGERLAWAPDAVVRHVLQPRKMTKAYIASWYFGYGRMTMRTMPPAGGVRYFGVPRHLFRALLATVVRWAACFEPKRRFRYRAEAYRHAGAITEAFLGRVRS